MLYLGIVTPVLIALAGMYATLRKPETARWEKRLTPLFAVLTLVTGAYAVYATHATRKTLEPWEATQMIRGRVIDAWARVNEADQTKDPTKLGSVLDQFQKLTIDANKSRAPSGLKLRVNALALAVEIWAITERNPSFKAEEVLELMSHNKLQGTPFEGRPDRLLAMLDLFRIQDFGPPFQALLGYSTNGDLRVDTTRLSKEFFIVRAHDLLTDVLAIAQ